MKYKLNIIDLPPQTFDTFELAARAARKDAALRHDNSARAILEWRPATEGPGQWVADSGFYRIIETEESP